MISIVKVQGNMEGFFFFFFGSAAPAKQDSFLHVEYVSAISTDKRCYYSPFSLPTFMLVRQNVATNLY